jgi:hypothetical protein
MKDGEGGRKMTQVASFRAKLPQEGLLMDLMRFTLKDRGDSTAKLAQRIADFKLAKEDANPSYHATCHVADRVLQVMEKKLEIMEQMQRKFEAYSTAKLDVAETLFRALQGEDLSEEAAEAAGFRALMRESVGETPDFDSEKADWPNFIRNIRLPAGHACLAEAKSVLTEGEGEWGETALHLCTIEAEKVLLPKAERQRRAEERRKKRIFMRAFPETLDGVTEEEVQNVFDAVSRCFSAARSFGNLTEKHPAVVELTQLAQDLQTQVNLLKAGGAEGIKIKR